jgi:hypothetical protein
MIKDLIDRASGLISTGKLEKNLEEYESLIEAEPNNPRLWMRQAEVAERLSRLPLAVLSFRTAALLMADRREWGQATAALKLAIKLAPEDEMLRTELTRIERLRPSGLSDFYARAITERSVRAELGPSGTDDATQVVRMEDDEDTELPLADSAGSTEVVHDLAAAE